MNRSSRLPRRFVLPAATLIAGIALGCGIMALPGARESLAPPAAYARENGDPLAERPLTEVIRDISPAVVSIGAVKRMYYYSAYQDFFAPFFRQPRYYRDQKLPYMGSGFLIDRDGHILTNYHVIEDSEKVFVTFTDGREVEAKILDADRFADVAMLKVDVPSDELPEPMELGDSDALMIGETTLAIGNPFGNLIEDPRPTVTKGVVSALHRTFRADRQNQRAYQDMIQTDAAINPGNSGGPLVDAHGRAIGVNTFIVSGNGGSIGLGFAIPINRAKAFVDEVLEFGRLRPLLIDFNVMNLRTPRVQGVVVSEVRPDGPAEAARLEVGDVIVAIDGRAVTSRDELILVLASSQVGRTVEFTVWRSGKERTVNYTITADLKEME
ncbi:MAG: serine protease Do [Candidatus Sumerlaeota bacterium]|nr:serine protease Do [Candidatus Sumerlaeota bacterium]